MKNLSRVVSIKIFFDNYQNWLDRRLKKHISRKRPSWNHFLNVGIDLVHIPTFARLQKESPDFDTRVFVDSEWSPKIASMAGIYAAKEATIKSLSRSGIKPDFREIIVDKHSSGFPFVQIKRSRTDKMMKEKFVFCTSISHHSDYAIAIVLCFKANFFARDLFRRND